MFYLQGVSPSIFVMLPADIELNAHNIIRYLPKIRFMRKPEVSKLDKRSSIYFGDY